MALRGNLRDFSLPDVFQLVTFSRKTGVLRIVREDGGQGTVWFREGEVFFASSNYHTELLGERLVRGQRITPQALARALELRAAEPPEGRRLGRILVDEGYITQPVLETFVTEQIEDTIFDLMRWEEGEFDFEAMPEVDEEDIGLSVSIENIVMEGSRRLEEWERIKKEIPSPDVVFKMATAPGEGTFEISLKPVEWRILLLTDASRSVTEIANAAKRTDFEVARVLYGLLSAGLLEFATDEEIERGRAERAAREARRAEIAAARAAAEQQQAREAIEREARLAAEASARAAEAATPAASAVQVSAPQVEPAILRPPAEEPQFLGQPTAGPTADDQAILEQFMGAVLDHPAPAPARAPAPSRPAAEEPAFMTVEHADVPDAATIAVSSIEDILPDLERDLMALGLGELPPELVAEAAEPVVTTPAVDVDIAPVVEPMSELAGMADIPPAPIADAAAPVTAAPDFSDLMDSLDAEAVEEAEVSAEERGFDADLLADDDVAVGGVISTDAFLDEGGMGGFGLSGGLTDELSALTGVERRQPARPRARVRAIPEEGGVLRRDARVDRDTVMQIIEGIRNL